MVTQFPKIPACLMAALDLERAYPSGCNCCEMSEEAVTEASALAALRQALDGTLHIKRYYVSSRSVYFTKKGNETEAVLRADFSKTVVFYGVFDSHVPFEQRTPIEEFAGHPGWEKARALAEKMNAVDRAELAVAREGE